MSETDPYARKYLVLGLVGVGVFMATLDSSIVNVSLPTIARYFSVPLGAAVEWVVIAYLVTVAALLLSIGRIADLVGKKTVWLTGLAIFTLGSMLCGAAPSLPLLIAARVLQGIGGASLMAISPAMLTSAFPPEQRGRAIGLNAVTVAVGISTGPTLGGLIVEHVSWRYIFYLNVPIGVLGWIATLRLLRADARRAPSRFDPLGALLLAVALASLTAGISLGQELGWTHVLPVALYATCLTSAGVFALHERRHPHPVVDFSLFRSRLFASASSSQMLSFVASFGIAVLMPFYFEELRGFSTQETGLLLTPYPVSLAVVAPLSGALADRIGTRWLAVTGMTILCLGLVALAGLGADNSKLDIIGRLVLAGFGQSLFQSPNNSALLGSAPPNRQGLASGLLATGRVIGQSLSVAFAGAVFATMGGAQAGQALSSGMAVDVETTRAIFLHAFSATLQGLAVFAAIAAVTSIVRGSEAVRQSRPLQDRSSEQRVTSRST
jgi:EmrB/QacA subfamily drug resistance transporter